MEKMRYTKKFGSLALVGLLSTAVLAACGDEEGSSTDADTIKIGANLELSGGVAIYGSSVLDGAELAIEEINANGGIDGKQIELVQADNKSENAEATANALKLIEQDNVVAMIGPATSGNTAATVELAAENKIPLITASGTAPNITVNDKGEVNEYAFRTCFIDPFQGTVAANFATTELSAKNVAIFGDNASDYAKGLAKSFKEQIQANGGTVVGEESYVAKDTDFRTQLTNLKSKNPDFIFIPGYYEEVGLIVKQARELGITVPLMGADGWDSPTLVELAGGDALNNTFITNHYSSEDPDDTIQKFVQAFKDANGDTAPNAFNALGYDTVYYLADAIDRADSLDGEAIKNALEETKDLSLVTGTFSIDENHNPVKSATVLEFVNGAQVFNSKIDPQ